MTRRKGDDASSFAAAATDDDDLVQQALRHKIFLQELHRLGVTRRRPSLSSLQRYADRWLPLVAALPEESDQDLIPPPDLAWLWHCHRLAPARYESYVRRRFQGRLLEARPPFGFQTQPDGFIRITEENDYKNTNPTACAATVRLWFQYYPDEPFFLPPLDQGAMDEVLVEPHCEAEGLEGFDLRASAERQATFLWQISGPRFDDLEFLQEAVVQYRRFLQLELTSAVPLVPTYQIDFMWHTHMLISTAGYQADCIALRGHKLHHDDSLNDRTPGGRLDRAFAATRAAWQETYGEDYVVEGGMYRGEPPRSYYDGSWDPRTGFVLPVVSTLPETAGVVAVGGSFSGGLEEGGDVRKEGRRWLDPELDSRAFIPARRRSNKKDVNSNPPMKGYIFGVDSEETGYYSLETREAYEILYVRLLVREHKERSKISNFDCANCLCWGCSLTPWQEQKRTRLVEKYDKTLDMLAYVKARCHAPGPYSKLSAQDLAKYRPESTVVRRGRQRSEDSDRDVVMYPQNYICTAGGCGGGGSGGGACGASGCGAGACGGGGAWGGGGGCGVGGCGGGGCGGGGCGGGGCGGGGCGG